MSNKIDELCTVVLPTFFPGDEIIKNIKSIPSEINILIIESAPEIKESSIFIFTTNIL